MDFECFAANRDAYGACSSWAVWDQGACEHLRFQPAAVKAPDFWLNRAVAKLNGVSSQAELDALGWSLNPNVVMVGLNFAERDEQTQVATAGLKHHAFHEETTLTSDQRLRDACCGTRLWGAYLTDLVKFVDGQLTPVRSSKAKPIKKRLRDEEFRNMQIQGLIDEINTLGVHDPTIIALGNDVHTYLTSPESKTMLQEGLGTHTVILKITSYSKAVVICHSDYVAKVFRELQDQVFI